ncbi:Monooxygenase [Macleaya cordata]|uniref:Monooxygenase n=1 Tax=Macleaya cordata TaxID=56857 RepID=A0A200QKS1_MACCD|nr:Monooxygenase [Macleaya cordata]
MVVIVCDGVNSIVSELLDLKPTRVYSTWGVRGFTSYPSGHGFSNEVIRMMRDNMIVGRMPVDDNLVYWFVARQWPSSDDSRVSKEPELIKRATVESIMDFPTEMVEIVKNGDTESVTLTKLRYRAPWDLLRGSFRKGTVIVAGDAMHAMGPFLGQGGSAALEDAIVLARNLAQELCITGSKGIEQRIMQVRVEAAMDRYVKERRMRLLMLSTQTYLIGKLLEATSPSTKLLNAIFLVVFFGKSLSHAQYNCGRL